MKDAIFRKGRFVFVFLFLSIACLGPGRQAFAAEVSNFISRGDYALMEWADGSTNGNVYVSRSDTSNNPKTYLQYLVFDNNGVLLEGGSGYIPGGDMKSSSDASCSLNTNTNTNNNFSLIAGSGGPISVNWKKNSFLSINSAGFEQTKYFNYIIQTSGSRQLSSASASGSVAGYIVGDTSKFLYGELGRNQQINININKNQ